MTLLREGPGNKYVHSDGTSPNGASTVPEVPRLTARVVKLQLALAQPPGSCGGRFSNGNCNFSSHSGILLRVCSAGKVCILGNNYFGNFSPINMYCCVHKLNNQKDNQWNSSCELFIPGKFLLLTLWLNIESKTCIGWEAGTQGGWSILTKHAIVRAFSGSI